MEKKRKTEYAKEKEEVHKDEELLQNKIKRWY
jgi:hypothetical protein